MLLEPVQGETGPNLLDDEVLLAARAACDEHGAALVFDEVQCGMGRTGTPVGVRALRRRAGRDDAGEGPGRRAFRSARWSSARGWPDTFAPGDHGSTFAGGPVVSAAALAALDVIDDAQLLASVRELGERLLEALRELPGVHLGPRPRADGRRGDRRRRARGRPPGAAWSSA